MRVVYAIRVTGFLCGWSVCWRDAAVCHSQRALKDVYVCLAVRHAAAH